MASDINSYALSIEFKLQSDQAVANLDIVDQRLTKIELSINNIATKTMVNLQTVTRQINIGLTQMSAEYEKINKATQTNVKPLQDASVLTTDINKKLMEQLLIADPKLVKAWNTITKEQEKSGKLLESSTKALTSYLKGLFDIKGAILESVNATEMFKNANFRLYGSQTELVDRGNKIAMQYGVMRKEAWEAISVLGNMKVPIEMLDKLTESTVKFNRLSGVTIQQTAQWQKTMVAMGQSANEIEGRLTHMAVAMRKYGLDTADATALMHAQQETAQDLREVFGDEMAGDLQKSSVAVTAFAKDLGLTGDQATKAGAALLSLDPTGIRMLAGAAGMAADELKTAEGQTKAYAIVTTQLAERIKNAGSDWERQNIRMAAQAQYGDKLGTSLYTVANQQAKSNKHTKDGIEIQKDMAEKLKGHIGEVENLNGMYSEANNTIPQQLALLKNAFDSTMGAIWAKVEPAIIMVLTWINQLILWITQLIVKLNNWMDKLGPVGTAIKWVVAIVMIAVIAFIVFNNVLGAFGAATKVAGAAGQAMGKMIQGVLEGLGKGLQALKGQIPTMLALAVLMVAMGLGALLFAMGVVKIAEAGPAGIKALIGLTVAIIIMAVGLALAGMIAQYAIGGLLVLAVVMLAAGVSAYLFGAAVQMIASCGSQAIPILITLAIVMLVVGLALIGLGALAMFAMPGLLVLGVTMLLVAVSALILAFAMVIVVNALSGLTVGVAVQILQFVLVMIVVGLVMMVAAPILIVGGLLMVAAGIILLVAAVLIVASGALMFVGGTLMLVGTIFLVISGVLMMVAAPLLIIGAIMLIVASPILMIAGAALIGAGIILLIGAGFLLPAAVLIMISGIFILIGGVGVYLGALLLNMAGPLLRSAGWDLMAAGPILLLGGIVLLPAAAIMMVAGILLLIAGIGILLGGVFIFVGAAALIAGATMLVGSGALIIAGAASLTAGLPALFWVSLLLIPVGLLLLVASIPFLIGSILLMVGALAFILAAVLLYLGALLFNMGVPLISAVMPELLTASLEMMPTGLFMIIGGVLMMIGAGLLIGAAVMLLVAGIMLSAFSGPIIGASNKLLPAGENFMVIGQGFLMGGYGMLVGAQMLQAGLWLMRSASKEAGGAADELFENMQPLLRVSWLASIVARPLLLLGQAVMYGGLGLLIGAIFIEYATVRLQKPIWTLWFQMLMLQFSATMIINAAWMINRASEKLREAGWHLLAAYFGLKMLPIITDIIRDNSWRLSDAARAIVGPAQTVGNAMWTMAIAIMYFAMAVNRLRGAITTPFWSLISTFTVGAKSASVNLFDTLDLVLMRLEIYGYRISDNSAKIARSLRSIVPTSSSGINSMQLLYAQTFATTRTRDTADMFQDRNQKIEDRQLQQKIHGRLGDIVAKLSDLESTVKKVSGGGGPEGMKKTVDEIAALLRDNLPEIAKSRSSGLANSMSEWMR